MEPNLQGPMQAAIVKATQTLSIRQKIRDVFNANPGKWFSTIELSSKTGGTTHDCARVMYDFWKTNRVTRRPLGIGNSFEYSAPSQLTVVNNKPRVNQPIKEKAHATGYQRVLETLKLIDDMSAAERTALRSLMDL